MVESKLDSFIRSAEVVVSRAAGLRTNGERASIRTQEYSLQVIRETCRRLHTLGFYLAEVNGLTRKHIDAVVGSWHSQGLTNKTIQNQFSRINIFAGWLGKQWLVSDEGAIGHLPGVDPKSLKVRTIADTSKSWTENGIDLADVIKRATMEDPRLGAMLTLGIAFGLRKKEMLRIKPWKADKANSLEIDGSVAKNGRYRNIAFEAGEFGQAQRLALDQAKKVCRKYDNLGWPGLSFKQAENKYYYHLKRLGITKFDSGVTGHGLRAEFAENILLLREITPPTLGGQKGQASKAELDRILKEIEDKMGHNDLHAIGAYFGTFRAGMHINGMGLRFGSVFIIDESKDIFAAVHCNPPVVRLKDGSYKQRSVEDIGHICITFVVEQADLKDRKVSLAAFIAEFPALSDRVHREMLKVGLGKREPGSN